MIEFPRPLDARIELLGAALVSPPAIRVEHVPALVREDNGLVVLA